VFTALLAAALVPELRVGVLAVLAVGLFLAGRDATLLWPIAAGIPVVINLAWGTVSPPSASGIEWCADPLSPPAIRRAVEATSVFVAVGLLGRHLRSPREVLGLAPPSRTLLAWSIAAGIVVAAVSLALGTVAAGPFFGSIQLDLGDAGALLPALVLAISNGAMEEVAYRGAMLGWLTPSLGLRGALLAQAIVFGAAHGGEDFVTSPLPVMAAVAAGGVIAGLIVQRNRSLTFPIAIHAAFDVPLYYVAACRIT
jgi:membrane protease YdiL (CAAX protease family)